MDHTIMFASTIIHLIYKGLGIRSPHINMTVAVMIFYRKSFILFKVLERKAVEDTASFYLVPYPASTCMKPNG